MWFIIHYSMHLRNYIKLCPKAQKSDNIHKKNQ